MSEEEMVTVAVGELDMDLTDGKIIDLIAALQGILDTVPEEFRDSAEVNFSAYDWNGIFCGYHRPMTDEEKQARMARIERQRLAKQNRETDEWIRNIRLGAGILDRDEAMIFLRTNPEANHYHPDVYRTGRHGHA